jgi:hypothetical protein
MDGMKRIGWDERCEYDQRFDFNPFSVRDAANVI